uniref:Uncharacterized protein n=1 Tax=Anguilla anguilla TaxID=7936 RepID=A0A0E9RNP5_ANGAN
MYKKGCIFYMIHSIWMYIPSN